MDCGDAAGLLEAAARAEWDMQPASTNERGDCEAFPDACRRVGQAVPDGEAPPATAFVNRASLDEADMHTVASSVLITGANAVTEHSLLRGSAAEPEAAGGLVSGGVAGGCRVRLGSSTVFIEGHPAAYCGSVVAQNGPNPNAPDGRQTSPSQRVVFVSP